MFNRFNGVTIGLLAVLVVTGCGGGGGGSSDGGSDSSGLVADAGRDQNVKIRERVRLDGSASQTDNGDELDYRWSFESRPNGSTVELDNSQSVKPAFTPDVSGAYVVELRIDDGNGRDTDDITVTSTAQGENSVPVAYAGDDREVTVGDTVELDAGDSRDADDDDTIDYAWSFASRPAGSDADLVDANTLSPVFTADQPGEYVLRLTVSDGQATSDPDTLTITAADNAAPLADAGPDRDITTGSRVSLDGSASSDANGDELSYDWQFTSRPEASSAQLSNDDGAIANFVADVDGDYVARLTVDDGQTVSDPDRVVVIATSQNGAPTADAGNDRSVKTGVMVELDGTDSFDPNDDRISYDWSFVSLPDGSQASLSDAQSPTPAFTPDVPGDYLIELAVSDGEGNRSTDRARIRAASGNSAPVAETGDDRNITPGANVELDGSASSDADNDSLSYQWILISRPDDSDAELTDADTVSPMLTADKVGDYVVELTVTDGQGASDSNRVTLTAKPALELLLDLSSFQNRDQKQGFLFAGLPYFQVAKPTITTDESSSGSVPVNRYRLVAVGKDFTITQVEAKVLQSSTDSPPEVFFGGLGEGTVIEAGEQLNFSTRVGLPPDGKYDVQYQFVVEETGDKFRAQDRITFK